MNVGVILIGFVVVIQAIIIGKLLIDLSATRDVMSILIMADRARKSQIDIIVGDGDKAIEE